MRLDGLPLAIELAAARTKVLPPQALLSRLEHRLNLLTGGARDLPQRQQTLRGAIAWSFDLLDDAEKTLFRRMSVFVGGCTFEAVEAVCGEDLALDVLDGVSSLVDKSLLKQDDDESGEPRFRMLETIREFGLEQLEASGEENETRRRHAAYHLELVQDAETIVFGPNGPSWFKRLSIEQENFRAAVEWSFSQDIEMAARLISGLTHFWRNLSRVQALRQSKRLISHLDQLSTSVQIEFLTAVTELFQVTDWDTAQILSKRLLALSQQANQQHGTELALRYLSACAMERGEFSAAIEYLNQSLEILREIGSLSREAWCLFAMGAVYHIGLKDFVAARQYSQESAALFEQLKDERSAASPRFRLGYLLDYSGDIVGARAMYKECMTVLERYGDRATLAWVLFGLANLSLQEADCCAARQYLTDALNICVEQGTTDRFPDCLAKFAYLAALQGEWPRAARLWGAQSTSDSFMRLPVTDDSPNFIVSGAKAALGESGFEAELAAGCALSLDAAVAYALKNDAVGDAH